MVQKIVDTMNAIQPTGWRRMTVALTSVVGVCVVEFVAQMWNTSGMSMPGQFAIIAITGTYFGFYKQGKDAETP